MAKRKAARRAPEAPRPPRDAARGRLEAHRVEDLVGQVMARVPGKVCPCEGWDVAWRDGYAKGVAHALELAAGEHDLAAACAAVQAALGAA